MARIKKYGITYNQPLSSYGTFILDTEPNSKYFKITEFKETFTGGKNGFLIEGSEHLMQNTEIKIQVLDVDGNSLYVEYGNGIPEYYEGTSKIAAVYVYEDTPIGPATITILGELKTYVDDGGVVLDVPEEWRGNYNIKWNKTFKINRLLSNEDKVRFYKRPKVEITEIIKPVFATTFANISKKGFVTGTPIVPIENTKLADYTLPTSYKLTTTDGTAWTGSMVDSAIELTDLGYTATISDVLNKTEILVRQPYTENGLVTSFTSQRYTSSFNYIEGVSNIASALTGSFAKISLTDLETFVGDVARVKIFRKSQSQIGDYQFIQEVKLETSELLVDLESQTTNQDYYGIFTQDVINNYWITSSNNLTAEFNQNYLYDSTKLSSTTANYFFTTKSLEIIEGNEYTLNFNTRLESNVSPNNYLRVFLSGSRTTTIGGVTSTSGVEQTITTINSSNSILQKTTSIENIKAEQIDNARLYFEVKGNAWYISNVSFTLAQETAFSPDAISFIQSVPRNLPVETFDYRFEFYDINNNYIPVLVEQTKTFNGGNIQNLQKSLIFSPRTLIFQFDSGSNPVPPTVVGFNVIKNLLTGSVTYTSQSYDFDGTELTYDDYTASGQFPGLLSDLLSDTPSMTVGNFTGSREDKLVQIVKITGETEGYTDTIIFTKVLDGFGGVNHIIRPYRGTDIRNSSTQSLEIQAVRIDGVNDIELSSTTQPNKGWPTVQLHILSASADLEYFINLEKAVAQNYIQGLSIGELGSKELNYNAVFNRDSIDKRRTIYLIKSGSITAQPAYIASASVLSSIVLSDLQDGLDSGFVSYDTDVFNINFRNDINFSPVTASVTASFYVRGTNMEPLTASLTVFPSMSINNDFVPEYWVYYVTHSSTWNENITIVASDDNNFRINSGGPNSFYGSYVRSPLSQSKTLTTTFKYTEPYTLTEVTIDKTFTIVPAGKPGDESIIFEINPQNVSLKSNAKGEVNSYQPSITDIKLKQGSRYLAFTGSREPGTFHIATASIISQNITGGLVYFDNAYTESLIVSASSNMVNLSGSITYPLEIQPYYTSSVYTASIVQNFTKVLDGAPSIQVILSPTAVALNADEVGYVSNYSAATTTIQVKDGDDFLKFTTTESFANSEAAKGTFRISNGASVVPTNIQIESIQTGSNINTGIIRFNRFDYPFVSASATYNIVAFPYSLGPGHQYTSSILQRTQAFSKSVSPSNSRNVDLSATSTTVNFDGDGVITSPLDPVILTATATNTTGAVWYQFYKDDVEYTAIQSDNFVEIGGGDAVSPGETATWSVKIRDGNSSSTALVRAQSSLSIAGIKEGATAYNVVLTNENSSAVYRVSGQITFSGTGTTIKASKGDVPLLHKTTFSTPTTDQFGNDIGSIGEYQVTIHSKPAYITLAGGLVSSSIVPTVSDEAVIGNVTAWTSPETNASANIVYRIDIENGRQNIFKTQSLAIQYEGATGPGIVMRGQWNEITNYSGSVETIGYRRDAVIYPDPSGSSGETHYFAAISGSGPTTYNKVGTLVGKQIPPSIGTDNAYWQYLGKQDFFVAAKIAIFEESFVKNTINVGNNIGSSFANIVLNGGRVDPYMAIGQYSSIGYGNSGIFLGIYDEGGGTYSSRFSMVNSGATRYLRWNGSTLEIKGDITVTGGDAATQNYAQLTAGLAASGSYAASQGYTGTAIQTFSGSLGALAAIDAINSGSATTYIGPGAIVTNLLATNAIMSVNYSASVEAQPYSDTGTFLDLSNGSIKAPGFAISSTGNASFKGFLSSSNAVFGAWELDAVSLTSTNGRIKLDASAESITVLDTSNNPRFIANTDSSLPSVSSAQPSPTSTTSAVFSFSTSSNNASNNSNITDLYNLTSFTSATGGGKHLATYTYNPSSYASSYAYANGDAGAALSITLVVTDASNNIVSYGDGRYIYAYGSLVDECGGGGGGYIPVSVTADTIIEMSDGSTKFANEINKDDKILSFNGINFVEDTITQVRTRPVHYVYLVKVGDIELKVSDSHTFWANNDNNEISVKDLIEDVSEIYVKVGNTFELRKVDSVSQLGGEQLVYSFSVENNKNYVSNGIISHNSEPYCYTFTSQTMYLTDPSTFTITTGNLSSATTYKLQLLMSKYIQSNDTSVYTAYEDSVAELVFDEQGGAITLQRISAGTIANGGGFQSVISDTKYLQVIDGTGGGTGASLSYSTAIKGNLLLKDGTVFSDSTSVVGYAPAVKAFAFVDGFTGTPTSTGYNITGVTKTSTGGFTATMTTAMPTSRYAVVTGIYGEPGSLAFDAYWAAKIGVKITSDSTFEISTVRSNNLDKINPQALYFAVLYL